MKHGGVLWRVRAVAGIVLIIAGLVVCEGVNALLKA